MKRPDKKTLKRISIAVLITVISTVIRAVSVHVFMIPNNFAPGGVTGIATMIQYKFPAINSGYSIFILNLPLLILSWKFLSKEFALYSLLTTVLITVMLPVLEALKIPTYSTNPLLAALACGGMSAVALSMMYQIGGSTGGSDIVASLIQKKYPLGSVQTILFVVDGIVVLISGFVFGSMDALLLAIVEIFIASSISENIMQGMGAALKFEIVTTEPERISKIIMERLDRGVTCLPAKGMFTQEDRSIIVCIVRKRQVAAFKRLLKEEAQQAFIYVTLASEVIGKGFSSS